MTAFDSLAGRLGAEISWSNTVDRVARTAPARAAADARFLAQADGDPVRAEHLRKAHFARMALKSAQARRARARSRRQPVTFTNSAGTETTTTGTSIVTTTTTTTDDAA